MIHPYAYLTEVGPSLDVLKAVNMEQEQHFSMTVRNTLATGSLVLLDLFLNDFLQKPFPPTESHERFFTLTSSIPPDLRGRSPSADGVNSA